MKKILFPTDFSPAAENAYGFAVSLALEMNAVIDVANVYHLPFIDAANVPAEYIDQMMEEKKNLIQGKLEKLAALAPDGVRGEVLPIYGIFVPQEIEDLAKERQYDLVVMGTRGADHSSLEKVIGSITTYTMMQVVTCPILAVPADARWKRIKRIAYAMDLKSNDEGISKQLLYLSQTLKADVMYLHVKANLTQERESEAGLDFHAETDSNITVVNSPTVMEGIDKFIVDNKVDILSLFIPQRRLWERLFHNSLTKRMTFHAKTPLLVFHE
jgi:nucleotide-binding universal stress UspA family protein